MDPSGALVKGCFCRSYSGVRGKETPVLGIQHLRTILIVSI